MPSNRPHPPVHKQLSTPESNKKPRIKHTKKVIAYARGNAAQKMLKGTVTALRSDNTANIKIQGQRFNGVPLANFGGTGVNALNVGDGVWVHHSGSQYLIFGKQNSDDLTNAPTIFPVAFPQWTWGVSDGLGDKTSYGGYMTVGRKTEKFPANDADYLLRLGIQYYDGVNNLMTGPADLVKQIDLFLERSEWDGGYDGPASFTLFGVKNDAMPLDPANLVYQTTLVPASIDVTIEPGEMKIITLPDTWRNNIGGTVGVDTIRGFVIEPQGSSIKASSLSQHTYGQFLASISGGLLIH